MRLREAVLSDVDAVVDVQLVAMLDDPAWDYRFQHRKEHPEDHRKFQRLFFQFLIDPSYEDWVVMVAESLSVEDSTSTSNIVAFAVWDISYINKRKYGASYVAKNPRLAVNEAGGLTRKDVNPIHRKAFGENGAAGRVKYFDSVYGPDQIRLQILGTLPTSRRHGFGAALCKWGMSRAKDDNVVMSLLASPMGFQLYRAIGFQELGTVVVQVPGEEESLTLKAMVFKPEIKPGGH